MSLIAKETSLDTGSPGNLMLTTTDDLSPWQIMIALLMAVLATEAQISASEACLQRPPLFPVHQEERVMLFSMLEEYQLPILARERTELTCQRPTSFWSKTLIAQRQSTMLVQHGPDSYRICQEFAGMSSRPLGIHRRESTSVPE